MSIHTDATAQHGLGEPIVLRREDSRFLTGAGSYTNDIDVPGQLHGAFVRSDYAHGTLRSIDIAEATGMPGVVAVFTGEDLKRAGVGFIHRLPLKGFDLGKTLDTPRPGLAQERVRYVGEPLALVVASTASQASDAAVQIRAEIEQLPCVTDVEEAFATGAVTFPSEMSSPRTFRSA